MTAPDVVLLTMGAVIAALAVFATAIILGLRLLRALRVEPELPEGVAWEPPPPPCSAGVPADAAAERARRERRAAVYAAARDCWQAARECQELAGAIDGASHAGARQAAESAARICTEAVEPARRAMRLDDVGDAEREVMPLRTACIEALARAQAAVAGLPDPEAARRRRLILWLAVALALVVVVLLLPRPPA